MLTKKELPRTGTFLIPWGHIMPMSGCIIKVKTGEQMHFAKLPSKGNKQHHVKMLCGAEYSLALPDGERPWTHDDS